MLYNTKKPPMSQQHNHDTGQEPAQWKCENVLPTNNSKIPKWETYWIKKTYIYIKSITWPFQVYWNWENTKSDSLCKSLPANYHNIPLDTPCWANSDSSISPCQRFCQAFFKHNPRHLPVSSKYPCHIHKIILINHELCIVLQKLLIILALVWGFVLWYIV